METLKPCPFCGSEAALYTANDTGAFYAACRRCDGEAGGYGGIADAVRAWNSRVGEAPALRPPFFARLLGRLFGGKEAGR